MPKPDENQTYFGLEAQHIFDLKGKHAVITGGAGLLGRMHAEVIAEAGGCPILADTREGVALEAAEAIRRRYGVKACAVQTDITQKADIEALRDFMVKQYGRIDILINNAANDPKIGAVSNDVCWSRFENFPLERWNQDLAVGLTGAFLCSQVLGDQMAKAGRGVILNISSDLGVIAPDQRIYQEQGVPPDKQAVKPVTYSVVKTAVIGLTRYLATYWAKQGIRVNALCPGGVEAGQSKEFIERLSFRIPMGRMARKDEYKGAVLFLVSEASSYMTGNILIVDGGRSAW